MAVIRPIQQKHLRGRTSVDLEARLDQRRSCSWRQRTVSHLGLGRPTIGGSFPYGTLMVNLSGSLLLGVFIAATTERFLISPELRTSVAIGFLGAFTTFSTLSYESVRLITDGAPVLGVLNLVGSPLAGGILAYAGYRLGTLI